MDARLIGRMKVGFMLSARAFGTTIKTHFSMSGVQPIGVQQHEAQ